MEEENYISEHELEYCESESEDDNNLFTFIDYEPPSTEHFDKVSIGCAFILGVLIFCIPSFFIGNNYSEL